MDSIVLVESIEKDIVIQIGMGWKVISLGTFGTDKHINIQSLHIKLYSNF